jgi:hypothetical protein
MAVADSVPQPLRGVATRIEQQLRVAHWVGEMTVTMARNSLRQQLATTSPSPQAGESAPGGSAPIPGYDELTAAQVVAVLSTLSTSDLQAVHTYEAANRARRTVIAKVDQLLAAPR